MADVKPLTQNNASFPQGDSVHRRVEHKGYDHGLIFQFADKYASRRDGFTVVWERENNPPSQTSATGSSTLGSSGDAPSPRAAEDNIAPSLKNVKLMNQGAEVHRGVTEFSDTWERKSNPTALLHAGAKRRRFILERSDNASSVKAVRDSFYEACLRHMKRTFGA